MPSVFTRLIFAVTAVLCIGLSGTQLLRYLDWVDYADFADELAEGRAVSTDLEALAPILAQGPAHCLTLRETPLLTLHFYASDLRAQVAGANPLMPSDDPALQAQRDKTRAVLERALACAPLDGNLWLSMAILSRAQAEAPELVTDFVGLSQRYAPHERWIAERRAQLF